MVTIFAALVVAIITFYAGYRTGKAVQFREMNDMDEPALTQEENDKREKYYQFCKLYDQMMTDDNFFDTDVFENQDLSLTDDNTLVDVNSGTTYNDNKYGN